MSFERYFREKKKGVYKEVSAPVFGRQDIGITPGGPMDEFAYECGNALVGNLISSPALEIIIGPTLVVQEPIFFALTGAFFEKAEIRSGDRITTIPPGRVNLAEKGDELSFALKRSGLRTYLCFRGLNDLTEPTFDAVKRALDGSPELTDWMDGEDRIRVIQGPEYPFLVEPDLFFESSWVVSKETNEMGMRLESPAALKVNLENMISEAVTTGTVQLTPNGPIILLRHRQTVGGYPRIFSVISADIDRLGQYRPGQAIRFRSVDIDEAWRIARQRAERLVALKNRLN